MGIGHFSTPENQENPRSTFVKIRFFVQSCEIAKTTCTERLELMVSEIVVQHGLAHPLRPEPDFSRFTYKCLAIDEFGTSHKQYVYIRGALLHLCYVLINKH